MKIRTHLAGIAALAGAILIAACSSEAPPPKTEDAAPVGGPPAASATSSTPRVFFIEPAEGATVKSPVKLKFGIAGYEISPVPAGDVVSARAGMGHHHVGVDTECLPPGTVIPKAAPWVHFGNGSNEIDMQLPPGQHKLTLEIGDDTHTTIPGLCTTITVNVAP
jgi:hypothetical protein